MTCSKCGATLTTTSGFCPRCGQPIVGFSVGQAAPQNIPVSASAVTPAYSSATTPAAIQAGVGYAGFWLRLVASIIDGIVLAVPLTPIFLILLLPAFRNFHNPQALQDTATMMRVFMPIMGTFLLASAIVSWLYWGLCESSSWQATLGKKALGLYVTDSDGNRATFGRTSGRFFAGRFIWSIPYLGGMYCLVDAICAGLTARKQAIHDMIAGCLVLRRL